MQKKAPKVTVREIAKQTGYAHCTVARALSDAGNVALETRSRILAAARELGYLGRSRKNIAVIMHEFGTGLCSYETSLTSALSSELNRQNFFYEMIPARHLHNLNEKILDGAISLCHTGRIARKWSEINPIPLVCINDFGYHSERIYSVCSDDRAAMNAVVSHLCSAGHRRVLYLDGRVETGNLNHTNRRRYFLEFAASSGIKVYCGVPGATRLNTLKREHCTAVICPFEMTDLTIYAELQRSGFRIPQDIELIHWHVPGLSDILMPEQFTLRQNFPELAHQAVRLLKAVLTGRSRIRDIQVSYLIPGENAEE